MKRTEDEKTGGKTMADGLPDLIFRATDGNSGDELYRVRDNGQVELIRDINPGTNSSFPRGFTEFNGILYFQAATPDFGDELWSLTQDGTAEQVANIFSGDGSSSPFGFTEFHSSLYFAAADASNGRELYRVLGNGSVEIVADLREGSESSEPRDFFTFGDGLYFIAEVDDDFGRELYQIDADGSVSLVEDIDPGGGSSLAGRQDFGFIEFAGSVYFMANDGSSGLEPYRLTSDNDIQRVADIFPGAASSNPSEITEFDGNIYFSATSNATGRELYRITPNNNVELVEDIFEGEVNSNPVHFTEFGGDLYFRADDGVAGSELHRLDSDGTVSRVADIRTGGDGSSPSGFTEFDGALYFSANTSAEGVELHRLNTDGSVELVADIRQGTNSSVPQKFTVFNDALYFEARNATDGSELYRLDGGDQEPVQVVDLNNGGGSSNGFGYTIFPADTGNGGNGPPTLESDAAEAASGFFTSDSSFADAIRGPSDARWYKIFDADQGGFITEGASRVLGGWVPAADLGQIDLNEGRYFVKSWGPDSGLGDFVSGNVSFGTRDSFVEVGRPEAAANQEIALDEVIDASNLADNGAVRVFVPGQQDFGFLSADELSTESLSVGADGSSTAIWIDTFLSGQGRSGWSRTEVTADADIAQAADSSINLAGFAAEDDAASLGIG